MDMAVKRVYLDAVRTKQFFCATLITEDGFPFRFERGPEYPLCGAKDIVRWLKGVEVVAFEGTLEVLASELAGVKFVMPRFHERGPRPERNERIPLEARFSTQRNAELLMEEVKAEVVAFDAIAAMPKTPVVGMLEELGL